MALPDDVRGVLVDIEGTTTPISFVYEVLFPYARRRLDDVAQRAGTDPRFAEALAQLRREWESEGADRADFGNGAFYAAALMDQDRKSTGLKMLQGLIWEEGYRSGSLRGQVFDDVPKALRAWHGRGIRLRVFSSGSVLAQQLLFAHSNHGDLTVYFEGYHDTTTGPKRERSSYETIARAFGLPPSQILFLSDVAEELDGAMAAGLRTGLTVRPGNRPVTSTSYPRIRTFEELV